MSKLFENKIYKFLVMPFLLVIIVYMCFVCNSVRKDNDQLVYEFWENKGIEKAIRQYIADEMKLGNLGNQNNIIVSHHCSSDNTKDTITISYMDDNDVYWLWKNDNQYITFCKDIEDKKIIYVPKIDNNHGIMISACQKERDSYFKKLATKEQYRSMLSRNDKPIDIFQSDSKRKIVMVFSKTK